jgi:hypothetical protein
LEVVQVKHEEWRYGELYVSVVLEDHREMAINIQYLPMPGDFYVRELDAISGKFVRADKFDRLYERVEAV